MQIDYFFFFWYIYLFIYTLLCGKYITIYKVLKSGDEQGKWRDKGECTYIYFAAAGSIIMNSSNGS